MKPIVRKADRTLAAIPKSIEVTAEMRRTFNALVYIAQQDGIQAPIHKAPVARVLEVAGFAPGDLPGLKHALTQMVGATIEWDSPNSDSPQWTVSTLLAGAGIDPSGEWLDWSYSIALWQELIYPTLYASIPIEDTWAMRTHASLALFEICSRYARPGKSSSTPSRSWRWWQRALKGQPDPGVLAETDLEEFKAFKRDLLEAAIEDVHRGGALQLVLHETAHPQRGLLISFDVTKQDALAIEVALAGQTPGEPDIATVGMSTTCTEGVSVDVGCDNEPLPGGRARSEHRFQFIANALRTKPGTPAWNSAVAQIAALADNERADLLQRFERDLSRVNAHPAIARRLRTNGWTHTMVLPDLVAFYERERDAAKQGPVASH